MLLQKLQADQITYLKSGNRDALETVRYILAQIKNKEIEKQAALTEDDVLTVLKKQVKEIKESIEAFEKGNRLDLLDKSKKQLELVSGYLPPEISDEELKKELLTVVEAEKAKGVNPKALIGICVGRLKAKADPSRIVRMLQSLG